jgi:NADH-quinone oxidoreductase subunit L
MQLLLSLIFIPLLMSILVGVFGDFISKRLSHVLTILGVLISFICSVMLLNDFLITQQTQDILLFNWSIIGEIEFQIGFLVDSLSLAMASMITFVSLMVHIYTIGYMEHDEGYKRFFSYISLFTFSMLMLIFSNNLLQLFFGWEAVGLVSYLLIGFWFKKPSAIHANMKAFIVNRVGDLGFIIGIAIIVYYTGSLHLGEIFSQLSSIEGSIDQYSPRLLLACSYRCIYMFIYWRYG